MAKLKDILIWYKFRPSINIWFSKMEGKSSYSKIFDETWYGGDPFLMGWFWFINLKFTTIHILIKLWKIKWPKTK